MSVLRLRPLLRRCPAPLPARLGLVASSSSSSSRCARHGSSYTRSSSSSSSQSSLQEQDYSYIDEDGRPRFRTVIDVLKHSGGGVRYVFDDQRCFEAMKIMIHGGVGSLMVKDRSDRLVGFITQRDLLRAVVHKGQPPVEWDPRSEPTAWNEFVKDIMTPSRELIFLTPKDTLDDARALMAVSGKRHIPVLSGNSLLGIMSPKDIAKALHLEHQEGVGVSAKESYVSTVMPRKGMPLATQLVDRDSAQSSQEQIYCLRSAVANLPHPFKESLGEDAFLLGPNMVGVADGVGSWWELDVDPAVYARGLMACAVKTCVGLGEENAHARRPAQVLHEAWHEMSGSGIIGSSTACLVALHPYKSELLAANVGDSGFIIIRQTPDARSSLAEPRGTLDVMGSPRRAGGSSTHGHHVAFRSPQQLRGFNAPYQLGRAPDVEAGETDDRFETPHDAALVRVPIKGGDIIILATVRRRRRRRHSPPLAAPLRSPGGAPLGSARRLFPAPPLRPSLFAILSASLSP